MEFMPMKKGRILGVLALLGIIAGAFFLLRSYLTRSSSLIEASGTIETTEIDVSFQAAGKVEEIRVQEGDKVTAGQVIARLDARSLAENAARAQAQLETAKVALSQQGEALEMARATVPEQQKAAAAAVGLAEALYAQAKTGPRKQEMKEAEAALTAAEAARTKARLDVERARELFRRQVSSQAALDAAEAAFTAASSQRESAAQFLDQLKEGTRKEQIDSAEAQLHQARAGLAQASAGLMQIHLKEKDVASAETRLQDARAALNLAQINLDYGELKSPVSGWVLLRNIEPGEVVNVGTPVVTLGDIEELWMNVYVGEREVGRLRLKDPVNIRVDAYETEVFPGNIIFISPEAEFTPKNIQTKEERTKLVYRVKVAIRNKDQKLKPGMPADAELMPSQSSPAPAS
jgi:HlyD family secretion protein